MRSSYYFNEIILNFIKIQKLTESEVIDNLC